MGGVTRVYRRADVEQVARIKHLLLVEGLTLAGARRKLEEEATPVFADGPAMDELLGRNARERLTAIKHGLRSILDLLGSQGEMHEFRLSPPAASSSLAGLAGKKRAHEVTASRGKAPRGKPAPTRPRSRRR